MGQERPSGGSEEEARGDGAEQGAREEGKAGWIEHGVGDKSLVLRLHGIFFSIFGVLGAESISAFYHIKKWRCYMYYF